MGVWWARAIFDGSVGRWVFVSAAVGSIASCKHSGLFHHMVSKLGIKVH